MPPTLILVRHAQARHNATQDSLLHDPELTQKGREQCIELREHIQSTMPAQLRDNVELIIVSPMKRTTETALRSLDFLLEKGVPIQADAKWQECSSHPCDTGSALPVLSKQFPQIDYSHLDPVYPDKTSNAAAAYKYTKQAILGRAQTALADLYSRSEKVIIVVSHGAFLRQGVTGHWFDNADYRVFDFVERKPGDEEEEEENERVRLKQWVYTAKTGGRGQSWDWTVEIGSNLPES